MRSGVSGRPPAAAPVCYCTQRVQRRVEQAVAEVADVAGLGAVGAGSRVEACHLQLAVSSSSSTEPSAAARRSLKSRSPSAPAGGSAAWSRPRRVAALQQQSSCASSFGSMPQLGSRALTSSGCRFLALHRLLGKGRGFRADGEPRQRNAGVSPGGRCRMKAWTSANHRRRQWPGRVGCRFSALITRTPARGLTLP